MSTITKEWLQQKIADMEAIRDDIPFGLGEDGTNTLAALRIALASLEAEFVGEVSEQRDGLVMDGTVDLGGASTHRIIKGASKMKRLPLGTKFYTSPPAPANAEPVAWLWSHRKHPSEVTLVRHEDDEMAEGSRWSGWSCQALYAAPPAPVSVPEWTNEQCLEFLSIAFRHAEIKGDLELDDIRLGVKMVNGSRAAMLQGADVSLTHEGKNHHEDKLGMVNHLGDVTEKVEPVTQIEPVADLYGLTSPTGGETSFTFDAVEARDFIDGGWSCQEYVELERFQEAITNHTEDKLAMVDHSGDSNNMVEPVTTANKLPFDQWLSQQTGTIDVECGCVMTEVFFHWLRVAYEAGNYPVIPDGWVACSELMPEQFKAILAFNEYGEVWSGAYDRYWNFYCDNLLVEHVTHWMPLPAAPQQEA